MNVYKISRGNWSTIYKAISLDAAQAYADSLGIGYVATYLKKYVAPSISEKLEADKEFCNDLIIGFVSQNREAGITDAEAAALLVEFKDILSMAQVGAVPSVYALLQNVTVGTIYTQERKDKDLAKIVAYMAN